MKHIEESVDVLEKFDRVQKWQYFLSMDDKGEIAAICDGYPPQELTQDQIGLSQDEWRFIKAVGGNLFKARSLLHEIEKKLKAHKKNV